MSYIYISCHCDKCVGPCMTTPGWMLPSEAKKAIENGFANRLMRDWWEPSSELGNDDRIYVLAPASLGNEGQDADEMPDSLWGALSWCHGRCTFLNRENKCELHNTEFKPNECRTASVCGKQNGTSRVELARLWNSDEGRSVIALWKSSLPGDKI